MDFDKRIPVLIKVQSEIEFGNKSFTEPNIDRCDHCGANIFYVGMVYGLVFNAHGFTRDYKVLGETEESKYYRLFDIREAYEQKICAVCGISHGLLTTWDDEDTVKEFEDSYDKDFYEEGLEVLQYPPTTKKKYLNYEYAIKEIKKWIAEWEEKREKRFQREKKHYELWKDKKKFKNKKLMEALKKQSVTV